MKWMRTCVILFIVWLSAVIGIFTYRHFKEEKEHKIFVTLMETIPNQDITKEEEELVNIIQEKQLTHDQIGKYLPKDAEIFYAQKEDYLDIIEYKIGHISYRLEPYGDHVLKIIEYPFEGSVYKALNYNNEERSIKKMED